LAGHDVNAVRRDLGENPATDIWLWGQGRPKSLEPFEKRFGVRGAVIAAVDLIRGIARSVGMTVTDVPGATGYLDTDYAAKGRAAVAALEEFDIVIVHVEAPDEAGPTPVSRRVHSASPPPFCLAGHRVPAVLRKPFGEANATEGNFAINPGYELMEHFLRR
jgi:2,3-bisphosphoglycerate-independent phosphoglycerate mutase